jgi:uncharacterized damage-inducible protein DinB
MSSYGGAELANAFRTVRNNTILVAQDIPEDKYDFVVTPGFKSVGAQFKHIAFASMMYYDMHRDRRLTTLQGYDFGAIIGRTEAEEAKPRTKTEIIELLKSEGDRFAMWLQSLSPEFLAETFTDPTGQNPKPRLESLLGAKEHEMHHRAQLMLIERLLGIVPHLTRQREERMRQRRAQAAPATASASA